MEGFRIPLLALLALLRQTASASDTTEVFGAVGGSVTFHSQRTATDGKIALWSFGNNPILTVALADPPPPLFHLDKYKTHFKVSRKSLALTISQLSMEDAGTYSLTIEEKTFTFTLRVYRELAEPGVTCEAQNCWDGSCSFSLRCSVPGAGFGNVSYSWKVRDEPWAEGPVVLVGNKSSLREPEALTCTARNAVSSRNVTVSSPGELCSENSTHPPGLPDALSGSWVRIGVIAGVVITIGISLVFLLFFCKSRGWNKVRVSKPEPMDTAATGEYTTVYAEVGQSQQRIPNGIKPKPTGGEPSTIYSLVKRPEQAGDGMEESATVIGLELV